MDSLIDFAVTTACIEQPKNMRCWTRDEDAFLRENLGRLTQAEIGEYLGRSEQAVKIRQVRKQIPAPSKKPGFYTANQVARLLGSDIHSITRLEQLGILPFHVLAGERQIRQISRVTLWRFAVNPENWIYFRRSRVRDPRLRRLIELKADRWEDEWWTPGQVMNHFGLASTSAVAQAIHRGQIPAKRWGNWWIKRSDALARRFYPCKGGTQGKHSWTPRSDAWILRARDELGLQYKVIAHLMHWDVKRVMYRYKMLKETTNSGL